MTDANISLPVTPTLEKGEQPFPTLEDMAFSTKNSLRTARLVTWLKNRFNLRIKLYASSSTIEDGEVFVFNHFARFETFIPQYLIYQQSGQFCRSVASEEFFQENNVFSRYLLSLGAVPTDYDDIFPFLAHEILKGFKVIIFPEGLMVKDRKVVNAKGEYKVFKDTGSRRAPHTGAAVLSLVLDAFRQGICYLEKKGKTEKIQSWAQHLDLSYQQLIDQAHKPTTLVPSNITFHPIRVEHNLLQYIVQKFAGDLRPRFTEELVIESNLLLRETDMSVRMAPPVMSGDLWRYPERIALRYLILNANTLEEFFALVLEKKTFMQTLISLSIKRRANHLRDLYMNAVYHHVTINHSHILARLVYAFMEEGHTRISKKDFCKAAYIAIQRVRKMHGVFLHRSIRNPEYYDDLLLGKDKTIDDFMGLALRLKIINEDEDHYIFTSKLKEDYSFNRIRVENPIAVYANEIEPLKHVVNNIKSVCKTLKNISSKDIVKMQISDLHQQWKWDKRRFCDAKINADETVTKSGAPYHLVPDQKDEKNIGILLVHGLLASPAELKSLGDRLVHQGYTVLGVRIKGHGTSPADLKKRSYEDWLKSVERSYRILAQECDHIIIVGFSMGGLLTLLMAAQNPKKLLSIVCASTPLQLTNHALMFVPFIRKLNQLTQWITDDAGIKPYIINESEHPEVNYHAIPVRSLYELRRAISTVRDILPNIKIPTFLLQGDNDPIVRAKSLIELQERIGAAQVRTRLISSKKHGIIYEDIDETQAKIIRYINTIGNSINVGNEE